MLAITRKVNESIYINDNIVIRILDLRSKNVKVGIDAPPHYLIFRGEIYNKVRHTNIEMIASDFGQDDVKAFLKSKGQYVKQKKEMP